jgi:phosphoribosyl 1,2-cyclic phosphodiesterase
MAVIPPNELSATIYGARGSLPNPSAATRKYGGATTCLGVMTPDLIPIVIDGGSGLFDLGLELTRRDGAREIHMFFTHTHWDHIQGLPFFLPLYDDTWQVHIYSLGERRATVREIFQGVYAERFFPVPFEQLDADIRFHELQFEDTIDVGATKITCCRVNHPGYALGFRVDHKDRSLFFASDSSPFTDMLFGDRFHRRERERSPEILSEMAVLQHHVESLVSGADLLFHDANYTDDEYEKLFHFGHASISQACDIASKCEVKRLVLWHHDRSRTDQQVEAITADHIERAATDGLVVEPARQGTTYHLPLGGRDIHTTQMPEVDATSAAESPANRDHPPNSSYDHK